MFDYWYAECVPCRWQEKFLYQDQAIRAAEDHVITHHRDVSNEERGRRYMGHVQNRTENAIATEMPATPALPAGAETPETVKTLPVPEWGIELAPTAEPTPGAGEGGNT